MANFWPPAPDLRRDDISFRFRDNDYLGHLVAPPACCFPLSLANDSSHYTEVIGG